MQEIFIQKSDFALQNYRQRIEQATESVLNKAKTLLPTWNVDIIFSHVPEFTIKETGTSGYTPNEHLIFVYLDMHSQNLLNNFDEIIARVVAHELHHAVRAQKIPWHKPSLIEAFVAEGLADHFDIEVNNTDPPPWSCTLSDPEFEKLFAKAKQEGITEPDANYKDWTLGLRKDIPKWAGYSIGFRLVDEYMKYTGKKASELVYEKAETFLNF